jgi:hypothetical protein
MVVYRAKYQTEPIIRIYMYTYATIIQMYIQILKIYLDNTLFNMFSSHLHVNGFIYFLNNNTQVINISDLPNFYFTWNKYLKFTTTWGRVNIKCMPKSSYNIYSLPCFAIHVVIVDLFELW